MDSYKPDWEEEAAVLVPQKLQMTSEVFGLIKATIGAKPAETGGILGGNRKTGEVTRFYFDVRAKDTGNSFYTPNTKNLNYIIKHRWKKQGIDFIGCIHSHPPYTHTPSFGDEVYATRILADLDLPYLLTPIVTTFPDTGNFVLYGYAAVPQEDGVKFIKQELTVDNRTVCFEEEEEERNENEQLVPAIESFIQAIELAYKSMIDLIDASSNILKIVQDSSQERKHYNRSNQHE